VVSQAGQVFAFPRREPPELLPLAALDNRRGRRECRVKASPMARQHKKAGGSHHRFRHPRTMALRLIRDLPGVRALLPPSPADHDHRLGTSVGVSGPHAFTVRGTAARPATSSRPSHPRLRCRDDRAYAPLHRGAMAGRDHNIPKNRSGIFFATGLDGRISIESPREFSFFAHAIVGASRASLR
jgi:hypothetical protein